MKSDWPLRAISELGRVITGSTPLTSKSQFWDGEVPFVTPSELGQSEPIIETPRTLTEAGAKEARLLPPNAILVCCIGSLGKIGIAGCNLVTNQQINSIVFNENIVYPKYGYYACSLLKPTLENMAPATTVAIISKSKFEALKIPLPPLEEQKRIAAILDQADALRKARRRAIARLNDLSQSIFYEMFGDPLTTEKSNYKRFGDYVRLINGRAYSKHEECEQGTPVIRIQNLNGGDRWFYSDLQLPPDKYCEFGDLLFAWSATFGPYIWQGEKAIYHYHIWKIECGTLIRKEYLFTLLEILANDVKRGGRGISMTHATKSGMEDRMAPIPEVHLQDKFVERIKSINRMSDNLRESMKRLDALFSSLQQRAFRGELGETVTDELIYN